MKESQRGVAALFLSYFFWGSMPIYWKAIQNIPSGEILAHRVIWSMVFTLAVVVVQKKWHIIAEFIRTERRGSLCLLCGGFLITANWWIYIWAVNNGKILETSLGYFINPLVSMAFGMLFFHEKLRRPQLAALILAVTGVCVEFISTHSISMVSIGLALTFGVYGVLKKAVSIDPAAGLFIETVTVTPLALAWLICAQNSGAAAFPYDATTNILLAGTGVITSVPLILFAFGAKRVPLTMLGFVQYVSPTLTFIIGTFIYNEPLLMSRICTFAFIWTALAVYTVDAVVYNQAQQR